MKMDMILWIVSSVRIKVGKKLGIKVGIKMITDFKTWMRDVGFDRTFWILEYRRVGDWTPIEMENKYMDQSQYVDDRYTHVKIKEVIELPDGDILIGYIDVTDSEWDGDFDENKAVINYRKLSQLEICWVPENDE